MEAPLINMNGNDLKTLNAEILDILRALDSVTVALIKAQYAHGRNSRDSDHLNKMREEKLAIHKDIATQKEEFVQLYKTMNK